MEDKELKKKLAKIPDVDKNGDPIFKIANLGDSNQKADKKSADDKNRRSR